MNKKLVFFSFITVVALGVAGFFSLKIFENTFICQSMPFFDRRHV